MNSSVARVAARSLAADLGAVAHSLTLPRIAGEGTEQVKWKSRLGLVSLASLLIFSLLARHPSPAAHL